MLVVADKNRVLVHSSVVDKNRVLVNSSVVAEKLGDWCLHQVVASKNIAINFCS